MLHVGDVEYDVYCSGCHKPLSLMITYPKPGVKVAKVRTCVYHPNHNVYPITRTVYDVLGQRVGHVISSQPDTAKQKIIRGACA